MQREQVEVSQTWDPSFLGNAERRVMILNIFNVFCLWKLFQNQKLFFLLFFSTSFPRLIENNGT